VLRALRTALLLVTTATFAEADFLLAQANEVRASRWIEVSAKDDHHLGLWLRYYEDKWGQARLLVHLSRHRVPETRATDRQQLRDYPLEGLTFQPGDRGSLRTSIRGTDCRNVRDWNEGRHRMVDCPVPFDVLVLIQDPVSQGYLEIKGVDGQDSRSSGRRYGPRRRDQLFNELTSMTYKEALEVESDANLQPLQ
jgi:hypothetical protein